MQESILLSQNLTPTTKKLVASLSKKIENIEYLIKIDHNKLKEDIDSYQKESFSVSNQKEKYDKELTRTIDELNQKEKQIYEIQKSNMNLFHSEIIKYDKIKLDMEDQIKQIESNITNLQLKELISYNNYHIINEDYQLTKVKSRKLKDDNEALFDEIKHLESTYPLQFSALLSELIQSKNNSQLNFKISAINKEIQNKEKRKSIYTQDLDFKSKRLIENETQLALLSSDNQFQQGENSIINLEKQIEKTLSTNNTYFTSIKDIIYLYYNSKDYSYETQISYQLLKDIIVSLNKLGNEIQMKANDLKQNSEIEGTKLKNMKYTKMTKQNSLKMNQMQKVFDLLANSFIYHKEIIALVDKLIKKYKTISSIHINDFYDTDFETGFINDLSSIINSDLNKEEVVNMKALLDVYFNNLNNKMKIIFYLNEQIASLKKHIEKDKNDISALISKMQFEDQELLVNKTELNHANNELLILNESIGTKSKLLKPQLDKLTVDDFEKYLKANEAIFPKFNSKIKNNVLLVKKEEFIEQVIINHSAKKGRMTECLEAIYLNQEIIIKDEIIIKTIEPIVLERQAKYDEDYSIINEKYKEIEIIRESIEKLNKEINNILEAQTESVIKEKKVLQIEYNIPFYVNKIANTSERIESLDYKLQLMLQEYEQNKHHHEEKEEKLQNEVSELKERLSKLLLLNPLSFNQTQTPQSSPLEINDLDDFTQISKMSNDKQRDELLMSSKRSLPKIDPNDPFFQVSLNNLSHLTSGLLLYKKFNQNPSVNSKIPIFNLRDSNGYPPEKCGYTIRLFRINSNEEGIMVQNPKNNIVETKIPFESISGLMIDSSSKQIINRLKGNSNNSLLTNGEYIQFTLVLKKGSVEVIAPNYPSYNYFQMGIDEIVKNKKKLKQISKYINTSIDIHI